MDHDEAASLLACYALDAVDDDERVGIEAHLSHCSRCRSELAEHLDVTALLANEGGEAPIGIWRAIVDRIDDPTRVRHDAVPSSQLRMPDRLPRADVRRRRPRGVPALAAAVAAAVVVVALLGGLLLAPDGEMTAEPASNLARIALDAASDPGARIVRLRSATHEARAVLDARGRGYLLSHDLDALPPDRTYQLWGIVGSSRVPIAVLGGEPAVTPLVVPPGVTTLAITDERHPGVVTSSAPALVMGVVPGPSA